MPTLRGRREATSTTEVANNATKHGGFNSLPNTAVGLPEADAAGYRQIRCCACTHQGDRPPAVA
jgi:hypothetical protein